MNLQDKKMDALLNFLANGEPHAILGVKYDDSLFEVNVNDQYLVLTDDEADQRCRDEMIESLWAFRAHFLVCWMPCYKDMSQREVDDLIKSIEHAQERSCEDANPLIKGLLGNNLEDCLDDAISADGRGHFLSTYDGEENEQGEFFIYRVN